MKKPILLGVIAFFLIGFIIAAAFPSNYERYEWYTTGADTQDWFGGDNSYSCQSFTVGTVGTNTTVDMRGVGVEVYKTGTPGTLNVRLHTVDASNHPNSIPLSTGSLAEGDMDTSARWENISMTSYTLSEGEKYAICMNCTAGSGSSDAVRWRLDETSATYTGGNRAKYDGSWHDEVNRDYMFEIWGKALNFTVNSLTYQANVTTGTTTNIITNISSDGLQSVTATLWYNNTKHIPTKIGNDSEMRFTYSMAHNDSFLGVNPFFFEIIYGGDSNNQSSNNQTVNSLALDDCSSGTVLIYNMTIKDEETKTPLMEETNVTIELDLEVTNLAGASIMTYSSNTTGVNPTLICINDPLSADPMIIDGLIRYQANATYVSEFYTIQNYTLTNTTTHHNISLYNLLTEDAQEFKITYKDENFLPVSNAVLDLQRYYIGNGTYETVEQPPFDDNGETLANLVLGDVIYTLIIKQDNVILATFNNVKAFCDNVATGDCEINLNSYGSHVDVEDWRTIEDVSFTLEYIKSSRTIQAIFSTTDGSSPEMLLNATLFDNWGNDSVCSHSLTSSSGTLNCIIPTSVGNSTAIGTLYKDGTYLARIIIPLGSSQSDVYGTSFVTLAIISFITVVGIGLSGSAVMTIFFIMIGVIVNVGLLLVSQGGFVGAGATFLWLIVALGAVLWKASRRSA